jgi:NAD(P)-dependent dehydrogenase (short-subunit alcohol dehydrogenase family)
MNRLDRKVALISGAARGIGAETARKMASAGASVVIGDVLAERARETAREIADAGGKALALALDVTAEASWTAAVAAVISQFGKLDILVNNAGIFLGKDLMDATIEDWSRLVAINMTGVWLGTKLCARALAESGKSSRHSSAIVNLASVAGIVGSQLDPLYSMTKGGVTLFTKSAALSFGRKGWKIRVNSIHPGVIETDMGAQTFVSRARQIGSNDVESARSVAIRQHPIGRLGVAEDIALAIVFLASDDAGFMTGSGMVVDGGLTAQ